VEREEAMERGTGSRIRVRRGKREQFSVERELGEESEVETKCRVWRGQEQSGVEIRSRAWIRGKQEKSVKREARGERGAESRRTVRRGKQEKSEQRAGAEGGRGSRSKLGSGKQLRRRGWRGKKQWGRELFSTHDPPGTQNGLVWGMA
jgi:hypothetical protein